MIYIVGLTILKVPIKLYIDQKLNVVYMFEFFKGSTN